MESIKLWTENIIIVVIISIIVEMILPEGNSKKYVKIVSGVYLLYIIINPIFNLDNIDLNEITNSVISEETIQTSSENSVAETYISSLESSIKAQIEEMGYGVYSVTIDANSDYSDISSVLIKMKASRI